MWQRNLHHCLWVLIIASVTSCWRRSLRHVYVRCAFYGFVCVALFCEVLSLVINTFAFEYLLWRPWRHADAIVHATFTSNMSFGDTSASWYSVRNWSRLIRILAFGYLLLLLCRHTGVILRVLRYLRVKYLFDGYVCCIYMRFRNFVRITVLKCTRVSAGRILDLATSRVFSSRKS